MKLTRQTYQTATLADAKAQGYNIVQLKYTRIWCRVEVSRGQVRIYDDFREELTSFAANHCHSCATLIGNYFGPHSGGADFKVVLWDCWSICQQPEDALRLETVSLETFSYRDRFAFLRQQAAMLNDPRFTIVKNFPIDAASDLWESPNAETCGLVYRRSTDPVNAPLLIARKYKEVPGALP